MLASILFLVLLSLACSRVTFDKAELLDHSDLANSQTAPFSCPKGCSVYSPSRVTSVQVVDDKGIAYFSLNNVSTSASVKGFTLSPGNYALKNTQAYAAEFTFYVVQKDALNFDTPVYTMGGKTGVPAGQRYVTYLTDMPGFRIAYMSGDLSNDPVRVYTTGAQALGSNCKPVYTSRSADNAAASTLNILGPIATIDFGSTKGMHYASFLGDYTTVYYDVGTTSIYVSPGFVGCGGTQRYANDYITNVRRNMHVEKRDGMCVDVYADYAISSVTSALTITVNEDNNKLNDTNILNKHYEAASFDIGVDWTRQGDRDATQFAVQIDLVAKANCNKKM